jgi:L-amino acid N-acyltransferase YncA
MRGWTSSSTRGSSDGDWVPRRSRRCSATSSRRAVTHRVTIDPATSNAAAIRCYEKAGFRRVGVMRSAEHDAASGRWHDALLMEYVVPPGDARL